MRSRPGPVVAVVVALGLLGVAACSGGSSKKLIPPPPTTVGKITTAPPGSDFTGIALTPVEGRAPVEPVEVLGGDAMLTGVVLGPDGPVAGATVRLERFVGDAIGRLDIITNADGTWKAPQLNPPSTVPRTLPSFPDSTFPGQLTTLPPTTVAPPTTPVTRPPAVGAAAGPGIFGGRYRIRAWRSPDLALTTPQILFVEAKQTRQVPLQLLRYTGVAASAVSTPDPPMLGSALSLTAVVTSASVDAEGVVRAAPAPGLTVSISVGAGLQLLSGPTVTNGQGRATFQLVCVALGQSNVDLNVGSAALFNLSVRPCIAPVTTSSTAPAFDPTGSSSTPFGDFPPTSFGPPTT